MSTDAATAREEKPYPGLRPFERGERYIFFGRDEQIKELLKRLTDSRFLAVVGVSGCGKSSLVRAGLIDALDAGFLPLAGERWRVATMRPRGQPFRELATALVEQGVIGSGSAEVEAETRAFLEATLRRGPLGLVEALREERLPADESVLLVVDQFEEIFRFHRHGGRDEADAFVALLLESAAQGAVPPESRLPVYVVLTMRSDFLGDCALFSGLPEALNASQFLTPRLTRQQRLEAITSPAEVFGGRVEEELAARVLNDMGSDPDQLPLMQHALMRMWEHARRRIAPGEPAPADSPPLSRGPVVLAPADYDAVGGITDRPVRPNALSVHIDEVLGKLDERGRLIAEVLFRSLTERGPERRDIRRPSTLQEVWDVARERLPGTTLEEVVAVMDVFRDPDLNVVMPPRREALAPETLLDITHETLIRQWKQLRDWVASEAESAQIYHRLVQSTALWKARRAGYLQPPELDDMLKWRRRERPGPAWAARYGGQFESAQGFLDESASKARRAWALRVALLLLAFAVIPMSGLTWFAFQAKDEADRATKMALDERGNAEALARANRALADKNEKQADTNRALRLSAQAQANLEKSPQRALLLAAEAVKGPGSALVPAAEESLRLALATCGGRGFSGTTVGGHWGAILAVDISPDGKILATGGNDGSVRLWNIDDPTRDPLTLSHESPVSVVAFLKDGRLVSTGTAGPTRLWNPKNEDRTQTPRPDAILDRPQPSDFTWYPNIYNAVTRRLVLTGLGQVYVYDLDDPNFGSGGRHRVIRLPESPASRDNPTPRPMDVVPPAPPPLGNDLDHTWTLSPDGRWLMADARRPAYCWDLNEKEPSRREIAQLPDGWRVCGISRSGRWAVAEQSSPLVGGNPFSLSPITEPNRSKDAGQQKPILSEVKSEFLAFLAGRWLAFRDPAAQVRLADLEDETALKGGALVGVPIGSGKNMDPVSSPDNCWLALVDKASGDVSVWNPTSKGLATDSMVLGGPAYSVTKISVSPDGHWLIGWGEPNSVRLWDLHSVPSTTTNSGVPARPPHFNLLLGHDVAVANNPGGAASNSITASAFSPDSSRLVTADNSGTARVWDLNKPRLAASEPAVVPASPIAKDSPGGHSFGLHGHKRSVYYAPVISIPIVSPRVESNYRTLVVSVDPSASFPLSSDHEAPVESSFIPVPSPSEVRITTNRRWLWVNKGVTTGLWDLAGRDVATDEPSLVVRHNPSGQPSFSLDGRWLLAVSTDGKTRLWDLKADDPARSSRVIQAADGPPLPIGAIAVSPDGRWLINANGRREVLMAWDLSTSGTPSRIVVETDRSRGVGGPAESTSPWDANAFVAFPSGRVLVVWPGLWAYSWTLSAEGLSRPPQLLSLPENGKNCTFRQDGQWLVDVSPGGAADLYRLTGEELLTRAARLRENDPDRRGPTLLFTADNRGLLEIDGPAICRLYDLTAPDPGKAVQVLRDKDAVPQQTMLAVSPDRRWLAAVTTDGKVESWDLTATRPIRSTVLTGPAELARADRPGQPVTVAFDARSQWLIAGPADKQFRLWPLEAKGAPVAIPLRGLDWDVRDFLVTSNRSRLVVAEGDGVVRVWDFGEGATNPISLRIASSDAAAAPLGAKPAPLVFEIAFGPDEGSVVAICGDEAARVWTLDRKDLLKKAAAVAGRNLTRAEWEQFFPGETSYRRTFDSLPEPPAPPPPIPPRL